MPIYNFELEKTSFDEVSVLAKNANEARMHVTFALKRGIIQISDDNQSEEVCYVNKEDIDDKDTIKKIKDYGLLYKSKMLTNKNEILQLLSEVKEQEEKDKKEENLKKNHMEFNFDQV